MISNTMNSKQILCVIFIAIVTITLMITQIDLLKAKVQWEGISYKGLMSKLTSGKVAYENKTLADSPLQWENISYTDMMSKMNSEKTAYDNKTLVYCLQKYYIHHPSTLPYNISHPQRRNPSPGQTQVIDNYLKQMRNGFFVDCGALDGEHLSNSLFLERYRNWTGILIEPNPKSYKSLISKHRKAYSVNACLSTKKYPSVETFFTGEKPGLGKVVNGGNAIKNKSENFTQVQCFSLYTILLAIGRLELDYFSLDVEGAERGVLATIPWEKVNIKTISIEHNRWAGGKMNLTHYMVTKGYTFLTEIKAGAAPDLIFFRKNTDF